MSYLSNTATIIDAVLTRRGREVLASDNERFSISHWALGDDEIDYGLLPDQQSIQDLPILEASTNEVSVLQWRLLTGLAASATKMAQITLEPMEVSLKQASLISVDISTDTDNDVINENAFYTIINEHPTLVDIYYTDKADFIVYENSDAKQKIRSRYKNGKGNFLIYSLSSTDTAIRLKIVGQKSGARQDFVINTIKKSLTAYMTHPDTQTQGVS